MTRLNKVTYQVGRTGAVTPVANLDPVQLSGTIVKRASLHNADIIEGLDLHIGDMVYVEKGGEIIPKITGVDKDARSMLIGEKVKFITHCPECGSKLIRYEGEAAHYCPNETSCPPQIKGKIEHFISRKAMNIDGLGPETVDMFYRLGLIKNTADLYQLTADDIKNLDRMGEKSAENIIKGIEASKEVPFERVLFALGIRFVGETVAKKIAKSFNDIDELENANLEKLINIDEIGEKIAQSILTYFANPLNRELIERLKSTGLQLYRREEDLSGYTDKLAGQSIVISGVFTHHSRDEYKELIEKNGGKVGSDEVTICFQELEPAQLEISFEGLKVDKKVVVENWIANFPTFEFEGVGAVIKGELKGENVPEDYVAELEVYFNDRLIEVCKLPLKYNHRKHELFFNYVQSYGKYTVTCKWVNPVEGADIWVRDVISYTTDK